MKIDLPYTFSGVRADEAPAVLELISACELHTEDLTPEKLRDFIVCRKGETIVGVVGLEIADSCALLRSLAVAERFRNLGIASRLVDSAQRYARSRGIGTLYLLTMTAEQFFLHQGYRSTPRSEAPEAMQHTSEFMNMCPDSAVCMRKNISIP